jgi:DNA-binding ferritin-like protein
MLNKTKKQTNKLNKTKKYISNHNYSRENIIMLCLQILNTIKLYHWKTMKYSEHKATDELYGDLNDKIDEFVEVLMGKDGKRINLSSKKSIKLDDFNNITSLKKYIETAKKYLINMTNSKNIGTSENSDLLNIRDEILGILNKFTYLLTLK